MVMVMVMVMAVVIVIVIMIVMLMVMAMVMVMVMVMVMAVVIVIVIMIVMLMAMMMVMVIVIVMARFIRDGSGSGAFVVDCTTLVSYRDGFATDRLRTPNTAGPFRLHSHRMALGMGVRLIEHPLSCQGSPSEGIGRAL